MEIHCKKALQLCAHTFRFMFPIILEWDPIQKSFFTLGGKKNKKYWPWISVVFGIAIGTGVTSCVFTILNRKLFDLINVLFSTILLPIALSIFGCIAVMIWNAECIVLAFKRMDLVMWKMEFFHNRLQRNENQHDEFRNISIFLKETVKLVSFIGLFFPLVGLYAEIDPYINIYNYYIKPRFCGMGTISKTVDIMALCIRFILAYFDVLEACRCFGTLVITIFLWLELQTKYFDRLKEIPSQQFFPWYNRYRIALRTWEDSLSEWIRILMGTFFAVIVVCNVVSVKYALQGKIPICVAWLIPTVSLLYSGTVYFLFPYIMGSHEDTERLLGQRKFKLFLERRSGREFKIHMKTLASLRPISLKCGDSFILKKETKPAFYEVVVARTVDGILMS